MANIIHFGKKQYINTVQRAWSDDSYYTIPYSSDKDIQPSQLQLRIWKAIKAKLGRSWDLEKIEENAENTGGMITVRSCYMIGD